MKRIGRINIIVVFIVVICVVIILEMRLPREVREAVSNGVIASVEEVGLNGDKVTVEVSLQREDGRSFEEDTRIGEVEIKGDKSGVSYRTKPDISRDNKVINYAFDIRKAKDMKLDNITINLKGLVLAREGEKILDESIEELHNLYPLAKDYRKEQESVDEAGAVQIVSEEYMSIDDTPGIRPIEEIDNFKIVGVGFDRAENYSDSEKEFLHIRTIYGGERGTKESEARISGLYNELTGEEINYFYGSTYSSVVTEHEEISIDIDEDYFEVTETDKIKSLKPIVGYTLKKVIDEGEWQLRINLKKRI